MTENEQMGKRPTVAIVGGGYGGVVAAKALDAVADVVLIEPRDAFMHNIAALRALVAPSWLPHIYMPYDRLLERGRVVRDRAVLVSPGRVVTASGHELTADYVVLATGSSYPFPAKSDFVDASDAHDQVRGTYSALAGANSVLLLGGGPVGIELAGEIRHVWPDKSLTVIDPADDLLTGPYQPELRSELRRQLVERDVQLLLGTSLATDPPTRPGELGTFIVATKSGLEVTADIWFRCFGVAPNSEYLGPELSTARRPDGFVEVACPPGGRPGWGVRHRRRVHGGCEDGRVRPPPGRHRGREHYEAGPRRGSVDDI